MRRSSVLLLFVMFAALGLAACNGASEIAREEIGHDGDHGFMVKTIHRGIWTRKYGLFIPYSYRPGTTQKYPVIVFLHGVGEGSGWGEGDLKNMTVGLGPAVARKASSFDFITIFPQSDGGWSPDSDYAHDVMAAIVDVCKKYPVDQDRIALTGLSTGGYGTWAIGAKYHERFSALVPMGSNGNDLADADKLTNISVRAYCSFFGDMFAGFNDQDMVKRIKQLNPSANATFISTPTVGHDCWENVYGGEELYTWLKQQRRHGSGVAAAPTISPAATVTPPRATPAAVVSSTPAKMPLMHQSAIIDVPRPPVQPPPARMTNEGMVNTPW